jgi:hypothetical protein
MEEEGLQPQTEKSRSVSEKLPFLDYLHRHSFFTIMEKRWNFVSSFFCFPCIPPWSMVESDTGVEEQKKSGIA